MKAPSIVLLVCVVIMACNENRPSALNNLYQPIDTALLNQAFENFKEKTLTQRRFTHATIEPLILSLQENTAFSVSELGKSVQKRSIYQIDYGRGDKKIMLWSQMHGDESTATMALFDLFNFLGAKSDEYDSLRLLIKEKTHLSFIPMLNPDGAETFNRRNALGIDINRDARRGTSPEGAILIEAAKRNKPEYAFNLHDQQRYYTAGYQPSSATISILAPAYNYERDINSTREDAMKIIVNMNILLQKYIPDGVAKYDDAHEPRGFGDNFQKWGARTVLIESGGLPDDPEKQYIRQLNFVTILNALVDIAKGNYKPMDASLYNKIPENRLKGSELVIRNIGYEIDSFVYKTDISIKQDEINLPNGDYYVQGRVDDVGDLEESFGFQELNANGLIYQQGKVYEYLKSSVSSLGFDEALALLKQGYYAINIKEMPPEKWYNLPLVILKGGLPPGGGLLIGMPANFFLREGDILKYAIVNGYLIDLENPKEQVYYQYIRSSD
jgi:hypothetical protein